VDRNRIVSFLLIFVSLFSICCFSPAQAAASPLELSLEEAGFSYAYSFPSEPFTILLYNTPHESGRLVLYNQEGEFSGTVSLPLSLAGGKLKVWVENLNGKKLAEIKADVPASPEYAAPIGDASAKVKQLTLTETPQGFTYSFSAPQCDYLILYYRNKQESGRLPVYPDENGFFSGEITLPMTYSRTLSTVQILSGKNAVLAEKTVRKGYELPPAPVPRAGRLSGVTVCIDPGFLERFIKFCLLIFR